MLFISHSTRDKAAALDIKRRMLERGYEDRQLFLDSDAHSGIQAGANWQFKLYEQLKGRQALIVLCSTNWEASKWCFAELVFAKAMGKKVFPVLLEKCDIGGIMAEYQAVFPYQEGEAAYDRLWSALEDEHLSAQDDFGWNVAECPFPGLLAFDEKHAGVFFGRERETQEVLEVLEKMRFNGEPRFLMIVGGSGSGKSSVLKAGVLPRLKRRRTTDTTWIVLPTLKFGAASNDVFGRLASDIVAEFNSQNLAAPDWRTLRNDFASNDTQRAAKAFSDVAQDLRLARGCRNATLLLVIDQFEEVLTSLSPSDGSSAARFLRFLHAVFSGGDCRLLGIGTLRSDYLDAYENHSCALQKPFLETWRLCPFPRERLGEIIEKPAARIHLEIRNDLVERIRQDAPTAEALPLLAFTIRSLYERFGGDGVLELQDYLDLGGMEGAIQKTLDEILLPGSLTHRLSEALRLCFVKHLAQVNEKDEVVRRTALWSGICADAPAEFEPILERFVQARLLVKWRSETMVESREDEPREILVEIAHEAMFRSWKTLAGWLHTSADILRWRRDVHRDRDSDEQNQRKWSGLSTAQLAVARNWPKRRRNELTQEEIHWINHGICRRSFWRSVIAVVVLLISGLAGWAIHEKSKAEFATKSGQNALVRYFFRAIGTDDDASLSLDEVDALWDLAEMSSANFAVRERLLEKWFESISTFDRAMRSNALGFRAVGDIHPVVRREMSIQATKLAESLLATMDEEADIFRLSYLAHALSTLADRLEPGHAMGYSARAAERLVEAIEKETPSFQLTPVDGAGFLVPSKSGGYEPVDMAFPELRGNDPTIEALQEVGAHRLRSLSEALSTLVFWLETADAAPAAERVIATMEKEVDAFRLTYRSYAFSALVGCLEPAEARLLAVRGATRLVATIEKESDGLRVSYLSHALSVLADHLNPSDAALHAARGIDCLVAAIEQETDPDRLHSLTDALSVLAAHLEPADTARVADRLVVAMENEAVPFRLSCLSTAVSVLAVRLEPSDAARGAFRLVVAMEKDPYAPRLTFLSGGLSALMARLEPGDTVLYAARAANQLVGAIEIERVPFSLSNLCYALSVLAARLEPADAAHAVNRLVMVMAKKANPYLLNSLCYALAALAARLEPADAAVHASREANRLIAAMKKEVDAFRLSDFSYALSALADHSKPSDAALHAALGANWLVAAMQRETDDDRLRTLSQALCALAARLEPMDAAREAARLIGAMEEEPNAYRLRSLGNALPALASQLEPNAKQVRLLALSYLLLDTIPAPPRGVPEAENWERRVLALLEGLSAQDLVEILKWPVCVNETEKILLAELERKLSNPERAVRFQGDLRNIFDQALSLGIMSLDKPAKRPTFRGALDELAVLR